MPQPIVQPLRRWDPERIGPYTIIGRLGAGAMGQVFLARSTAGRLVAVKTIRVALAEEAGFRARFAREVAAASRVSGVFTAAVIEADPDADLPWVATAYVPAPSLRALVRTAGPLPVPAVRWLAAGCAEALQSIHGAGLLHRDVKPSNVLVAPDGPRVIDFGVARASERVQLTTTRGAAGTPAYMAPEQARDASQASPASDIFSLGATLVYAATGHAPYQGETVMDILVRLATEPPDLTDLPEELSGLVSSCLERVPRMRPSNSAILGGLGSFALSAGSGHVYLPDSAMAVIAEYLVVAEYVHHPQLATGQGANGDKSDESDESYEFDDEDSRDRYSAGSATNGSGASVVSDITDGSQTPLPGFQSAAALPQAGHVPAAFPAGQGPPGEPEPPGGPERRGGREPSRRRARRRGLVPGFTARHATLVVLPVWARVVAAVALIALGTGLGLVLRGSDPQGDPASTVGNVASPPPCANNAPNTTPLICVSQPYGDGYTVYVIHGTGFVPFTPVTVAVNGVGVSPDRPVTDMQGTFNYAIDQGHVFFRGPIPPGVYHVLATASSGRTASVSFTVHPGTTTTPPPGGPGQPPPG
ncbi:MAG TPA: serine/threonine-protein kinase [Trebonia sp.]|jgi:serine/threonine protein kinase